MGAGTGLSLACCYGRCSPTRARSIPRSRVRRCASTVWVTGSDGYSAALALGEIAPAFEAKRVIVADQTDSRPLGPGHFRLVVPGDRYGGRSVRDVVRIAVIAPGPQHR